MLISFSKYTFRLFKLHSIVIKILSDDDVYHSAFDDDDFFD